MNTRSTWLPYPLAGALLALQALLLLGPSVALGQGNIVGVVRSAAEAGDARAQHNMGVRCWFGRGVPQDRQKAIEWYRRAADGGVAEARMLLGICLIEGCAVQQNIAEGVRWLELAAEQGLADAQARLADIYTLGRGVPRDEERALHWLRKAAAGGRAGAQCNMGYAYVNGAGVPVDLQVASDYFLQAAEQGDVEAQFALGRLLYQGDDTVRDEQRGARWLRRAASGSHAGAQSLLAMMYFRGDGVPVDYVEAYKWILLAGAQGEQNAVNSKYVMRRSMTPTQVREATERARQFTGDEEYRRTEGAAPAVLTARSKSEVGAGFFVTRDGLVMTANHLVEDASSIRVWVGGDERRGVVVYGNPTNDVAIIKVGGVFDALPICGSYTGCARDRVFVMDFPAGVPERARSVPVAAMLNDPLELEGFPDYFLVDMSAPLRADGCPLVNRAGNVVGVMGLRPMDASMEDALAQLDGRLACAIKGRYTLELLKHLLPRTGQVPEPRTGGDADIAEVSELTSRGVVLITVRR